MDAPKPAWEIAHLAANYLIDGIAESFQEAKTKAADSLGFIGASNLPSNIVLHRALAENLALLEGSKWSRRVREMRVAATQAMNFFSDFDPHLTGSVLYGTATAYSVICLHVYSDDLEPVIWRLNEANINYRLSEVSLKTQGNKTIVFPNLEIAMGEFEFDVVLFPQTYRFNPPNSPLDGKPYQRADLDRVQRLIDDEQTLFGKYFDTDPAELSH